MRFAQAIACAVLLLLPQLGFASLIGRAEVGRIRGRVHYPACFPPEDLAVCAQSTKGRVHCTRPVFSDIEITYQLEVPPGRWVVYSTSEATLPGRRGWFSRAVLCGLSLGCTDHTPITIEVKSGRTVDGVDPDDWFGSEERDAARRADLAS